MSLKRSCKIQFRRVDLVSIGPSSLQSKVMTKFNFWPDLLIVISCDVKLGVGREKWWVDDVPI